jgi:hypothetical protein
MINAKADGKEAEGIEETFCTLLFVDIKKRRENSLSFR